MMFGQNVKADGQMSARTHASHRGLRDVHTRRPCRMRRRLRAPRSSARTMGFSSSATFTGSDWRGQVHRARQYRDVALALARRRVRRGLR